MGHKKSGSSILLFLIVMFGLIIAIRQVWSIIAYSVDITSSRMASYQTLYYVEGMRVWAVEFVKKNFLALCNDLQIDGKPLTLEISNWPIEVPVLAGAVNIILIQKIASDEFAIHASYKHDNEARTISCRVRTDSKSSTSSTSEKTFVVYKWSI